MADRVGQQLGNYRLVRLLGHGGFADVFLGKHIHLDTLAAVKILHTQLSSSDIERFRNEARTIARLVHPHIVRVLDYGVEGNTPFLVMDYAPNGSLRQHHPKGIPLPLLTILHYVNQVTAALQYAHDARLVHRDVKPENMLLGRRNELLLSDFGIALVTQSSRYRNVEEMAGTISYMAPEQISAKPQPASDQYALGIVIYEWLSGEHPFHGSFYELASQHMLVAPPPLYGRTPGISPAIEQVVLKMLAKNPDERFVNMQALASAFKQACYSDQRLLLSSPEVDAAPYKMPLPDYEFSPIHENEDATPGRPERKQKRISRRRVLLSLAGLTVIAAGGTSLLALTGKIHVPIIGSESRPMPSATPTPPPRGATIFTYRGHSDQVWSVKWSPEGTQIASGSFDTTVQVWDAITGNNVLSYHGHSDKVSTVAWSLDGTRIASGGFDATVQVWDSTTTSTLYTYTGHAHAVRAIAWSPQPTGKYIASGSTDATVRVWDSSTRAIATIYRGHTNAVNAVAWSPDGTRIASAGFDNTVQVWDSTSGTLKFTYTGHSKEVRTVAWSPDGTRIASGGYDNTVHIWDANSGTKILIFERHTDYVNALTWSLDGKQVASASSDATVRVWDAATGDIAIIYNGHSNSVLALAWSPDGTRIASGGFDNTVQIWQAM